jgi:hypothetical protein
MADTITPRMRLPFPETLMRRFVCGFFTFVSSCQNHYTIRGELRHIVYFLIHKYERDASYVQRAKNAVNDLYEWRYKDDKVRMPTSMKQILALRLMHFVGTSESSKYIVSGYDADPVDFVDNTFTPWIETETRVRMMMTASESFSETRIASLVEHCENHMSDEDIQLFGKIVFGECSMMTPFKNKLWDRVKEKSKDAILPSRMMRGLSKHVRKRITVYRSGTMNYISDTITYNDIDAFLEILANATNITNGMVDAWVSVCIKAMRATSSRTGVSRAEFLETLLFHLHMNKKMYISNTSNLCHIVKESLAGVKCIKEHTVVPIRMIQEKCTDKETLDKMKEIIETFPHLLDNDMLYQLSRLGYNLSGHDKHTRRFAYRDDTQSAKKARQTQ